MRQTIYFKSDYGKDVAAEIEVRDDEVTVRNIYIGKTFYSWQQCKRHQWLLYNAIKNYMYE